jgi:hypothetical protein
MYMWSVFTKVHPLGPSKPLGANFTPRDKLTLLKTVANPTTSIYNASVVKINSATNR